ncbi:MAG TPA: hypothetical protein VGO41_06085 [Steroidobacteraceae bacterium]|jgi:phage tail sheath protein FI|nr:hypothetical protein [Steroidobacteraceae bacterium]
MPEPASSGPATTGIDVTARLRAGLPATSPSAEGDSRSDLPITPAATAVTAFIGRTLKGPVNEAVRITSFSQFQQQFGGLWQPSTLSYAVEQYFENGGEDAVVVRVASSGRPPTLDLPAGDDCLTLTGLCPGSREYLRASVDYDGIYGADIDSFNLVVQRVRNPGSELVEEQEIFRRLSIAPDAPRAVATVLSTSRLVRVTGPQPRRRPDISLPKDPRYVIGYVACNGDGDDGAPLSDYDIIGCEESRSGLFALQGGPSFNFLCIPPLAHDQDVGMSALVVAARFCRQQHALLLVDPPRTWESATAALAAVERWPFHSQDAVMYYPRIDAFDRLRGRFETFGSGGAAAGMIARADRVAPVWQATELQDALLRASLRPAVYVTDAERKLLAQHGVNCLAAARPVSDEQVPARTLGGTAATNSDCRLLSARRLVLFICASIERGTRWVVLEHNNARVRGRAQAQVVALLEGLLAEHAFAPNEAGDAYFVICDERVNGAAELTAGEFRMVYGFAALRAGDVHAWLLTHRAGGSTTRSVSVNRLATVGQRVEIEIETAILRRPFGAG